MSNHIVQSKRVPIALQEQSSFLQIDPRMNTPESFKSPFVASLLFFIYSCWTKIAIFESLGVFDCNFENWRKSVLVCVLILVCVLQAPLLASDETKFPCRQSSAARAPEGLSNGRTLMIRFFTHPASFLAAGSSITNLTLLFAILLGIC